MLQNMHKNIRIHSVNFKHQYDPRSNQQLAFLLFPALCHEAPHDGCLQIPTVKIDLYTSHNVTRLRTL